MNILVCIMRIGIMRNWMSRKVGNKKRIVWLGITGLLMLHVQLYIYVANMFAPCALYTSHVKARNTHKAIFFCARYKCVFGFYCFFVMCSQYFIHSLFPFMCQTVRPSVGLRVFACGHPYTFSYLSLLLLLLSSLFASVLDGKQTASLRFSDHFVFIY